MVRFDQVGSELFELGPRQRSDKVFRSAGICRNIRQIEFGLHRGRKFDLGLFGSLLQTLQGLAVCAQVDAVVFLKLIGEIIHNTLVEVITAKEGISAR